MKKNIRLIILNIAFLLLTAVVFILYFIMRGQGMVDKYPFLLIIFCVLAPVSFAGFVVTLFYIINKFKITKNLRLANRYQFGKMNEFPDFFLFSSHVRHLRRLHGKNEKGYIVSFSVSNLAVMNNAGRNPDVIALNCAVCEFIEKHFSLRELKDNYAYCFYHGQFVFYVFGSDKNIQEISLTLEEESYELASKNEIKVFVHPFIGVAEVDPKESLTVNVDNAVLARNMSEKNFEGITFYSPSFRKNATLAEIEEIKQALENKEFVVYYQPKFHLASRRFISSEALVRWDSQKYGLLSPAKFIEKAEMGGMIHGLDMYVFRRVCEDLAESKKKNKRLLPVSINFSLYEFYSPTFFDDITGIVKEFQLNPSLLEIEITETTSQVNPFMAIGLLKRLKECGFRILMDDFGLAYSNLGNLNKMPFDTVKIDKSFIDGIIPDFKTREIIRFLISLCKVSGMEVIAEGVDQAEQVNILRKIKCDTIQGFYYSKPLPRVDYEAFLLDNPFEVTVKKEEK